MNKYRGWLLWTSVAALAGLLIGAILWQRSRAQATPEALWRRLPAREAAVLYVDFAALRQSGLLEMAAASATAAEPEYREFVERTGFDYTTDLDSAMVAFAPSGRYFLVRGRFDWARLRAHAAGSGGRCRNQFCTLPGSTPERNISFLPLRDNLMALAVSRDDLAADLLTRPGRETPVPEFPRDPVWLTLAGEALRGGQELPAGTRMFARGLENAERIMLSLGPDGQRWAVRMEVRCRTAEEAAELASTMSRATATLRSMIERERHTPNPRDLSGVLAGGTFRSEGARMLGHWPVERVFFEEVFRSGAPS